MNLAKTNNRAPIDQVIGAIPYRLALAGGWIDQPFVSRHNPTGPGSMVVVSVEPQFRLMERSGMATGTRDIAIRLWRTGCRKVLQKNRFANSTRPKTKANQIHAVRKT